MDQIRTWILGFDQWSVFYVNEYVIFPIRKVYICIHIDLSLAVCMLASCGHLLLTNLRCVDYWVLPVVSLLCKL